MPDGEGGRTVLSCPFIRRTPSQASTHTPWNPDMRTEEACLTEMPADPGLNLEFVDEALSLVRDAEAKGIRLRILGSIAYRLQCPEESAPVRGYQARSDGRGFRRREEAEPRHPRIPDGARLRSRRGDLHGLGRGAPRLSASGDRSQRRRVRRRALFLSPHSVQGPARSRQPDHLHDRSAVGEDADRRDQPEGLQGHDRADARASALESSSLGRSRSTSTISST